MLAFCGLAALSFAFVKYSALGHEFIANRYGTNPIEALQLFGSDLIHGQALADIPSEYDLEADDNPFGVYYGKPMGILDRLSLIAAGDALVHYSLRNGPAGYEKFWSRLTLIPKSITGKAVEYGSGNELARRMGVLSEDDYATGISFGIFPDAFAHLSWLGMIPIIIFCFLILFVSVTLLSPTLNSFWAVILIGLTSHIVAETNGTTLVFIVVRIIPFLILVIFALEKSSVILSRE